MTYELVAKGKPELAISSGRVPAIVASRGEGASVRFLEFFAVTIRNPNTRRAYYRAARQFFTWCEKTWRLVDLAEVQPMHVAAFVERRIREVDKPSVKQELAAVRMLFDWLVVGQIVPHNPASSVRGPKHVVKKGKTPVLSAKEVRELLDGIEVVTKKKLKDGTEAETPALVGLRDRALIALLLYTFARVGAATGMKVEDCFVQDRRLWVRLHEKGGKYHEMPCHHNLEQYLHEYVDAARIREEKTSPLFRTFIGRTQQITGNGMTQPDVFRMIGRRARAAGIDTEVCCHTFRASGITIYLLGGGTVENAQAMAAHESPRTTKLYDRRNDSVSLDEVERIVI
ncbi:MAG: tyrosine-type recombinase/integrase [Bryobacterales bacterium]|nr:tyrosine-type recombinase/integrase [Bryobacterales bacterium]